VPGAPFLTQAVKPIRSIHPGDGRRPPVVNRPGNRFSYSGEGFVYLAAAVERITGETLEALVRRTVFKPPGMTSGSYVWQDRHETLKVYNHNLLGDVAGPRTPWRPNAGGINTATVAGRGER